MSCARRLSNGLLHSQQTALAVGTDVPTREMQKGRYRQFHQMSVEALGFAEPEIDAELIALSARLWRGLGISSLKLELNTIGTAESRQKYKQVLVEHFSRHRELLDEDSVRRLERNPLRILDSKNPALRELIDAAPFLSTTSDDESPRALRARPGAARRRRRHLHAEPAPGSGPRLLLAHGVRVGNGSARRPERSLFRRALRQARSATGRRAPRRPSAGRSESSASSRSCRPRVSGAGETPPDAHLVAAGDAERRFGFKLVDELREQVPGVKIALGVHPWG